MDFQHVKEQDKQYIMNTYGRFDACIVKGKGAICTDINGKEYVDFTSGIGVNSLGFADESWVKAVTEQAGNLAHISNLYYTLPDVELAKNLCEITGYSRVFFGNSGAEANEGAIKVARKYSFDKYGPGRNGIITLLNSFHGRTVTTLAATGQEVFHNYFYPFTEGFSYSIANDFGDFLKAVSKTTCAVMMEFIQGEGGVNALDKEYVQKVVGYCNEHDILVIADEVQTGVGRTGKFLYGEHFGVQADITTLAKGLGGGLPIGAVLVNDKLKDVLGAGTHGTTFGGNPVVCAGANAVMKKVANDAFLKKVELKGEKIRACLYCCPEVKSLSGLGLMVGIELKSKQSANIAKACLEKGLLVLTAKTKVRLLPPLTITDEELTRGLNVLWEVLS